MKRLVIAVAALVLATPSASAWGFTPTTAAVDQSSCGSGNYVNSRGNCVRRPVRANRAPQGASAKCRDGTYSFSQSRRGTCSHHGGVAVWL